MIFNLKYKCFFVIVALLASCGNSSDRQINSFTSDACKRLKNNITAKVIKSIECKFNSDFVENGFAETEDLKKVYSELNNCFINSGYHKILKPLGKTISGNGADYFMLKGNEIALYVESADKALLSARIPFSCSKKINDTVDIEMFATLGIYNDISELLKQYELYLTPEFTNSLKIGKGDFVFLASLDAVWDETRPNPFASSAEVFSKLDNASKFEIVITIRNRTFKKNEQEQNHEYQEMLDEIKIN